MFKVEVNKHSVSPEGKQIMTQVLCYPRFIHSELMTHRVFSRNAMSSRAIPVAKMIQQVRESPAMPVHWGANQPGMQASDEVDAKYAEILWKEAAGNAARIADEMASLGLHKQVANRILEPFQWMRTIVTSTEWDNFYELRTHKDAQPEFQKLAVMMMEAAEASVPQKLAVGQWHLPYVDHPDWEPELACKISAARCARVSYLLHDGGVPDVEKDLALFERLAGGVPMHASPLEHQATPGQRMTGNLQGWTQFRKVWEVTHVSR